MTYRIEFHPLVYREMQGVPARLRTPIKRAIQALAVTPHPPRSLELRNHPGRYRLRVET